MEIFNLYNSGKRTEAEKLQIQLAVAEWGFGKGGINGTKWVVAKYLGYPEDNACCRRPYPKFLDEEKRAWITKQVNGLQVIEQGL
jgi:dihydrodipicolinate synthase/N-acetylneuraminate lyase